MDNPRFQCGFESAGKPLAPRQNRSMFPASS
ncbi:MAG: hypothetical protein ACI9AX_000998, partial [Polaromonas sp.]